MKIKHSGRKGFTLVELLVVIGVLAILIVAAILFINPSQLASQGRDTNRVSDITTLNQNVALYHETTPAASLGTSGVLYVSIPDPTATSTAGDQCQGLGLPTSTYTYHCAASSTYRNVNGTGWVPINFSAISGISLATLPIDPVNMTSSNEYYVYTVNGTQYELLSNPESQKSASSSFTQGSNIALATFPGTTILYTTSTLPSPNIFINDLAFDSRTNSMWTETYLDSSNRVTLQIDDTTYATSTTPGLYGYGIAFDSNTNTKWIEQWLGGSGIAIEMNDTAPYATTTIPVDTSGNGIAFDSNTKTMWYTSYSHAVTIMNDTTPYATTTVSNLDFSDGNLAFDSHTNTMWFGSGVIMNDTAPYATTTFPGTGVSVAFDSHTNSIWLTSTDSNHRNVVTQMNDTTFATTTYVVGGSPTAGDYDNIVFDSHNNTIWVIDPDEEIVTILTPDR